MKHVSELRGKKIVVVGMGKTAMALVPLLVREGAEPAVSERQNGDATRVQCDALRALGVEFETGGHTSRFFANADFIVPSPGVPTTLEAIREGETHGARIVSELEVASSACTSPILAVTGTNGKTTTTELVRHLIAGCGHEVVLAGNNATPFSAVMASEREPDYIVLEVSSYQLEHIESFRPWIGAMLNVSPDHLERHGTLEAYARTKARMFENQGETDGAVFNYDDRAVRNVTGGVCARKKPFSVAQRLEDGLWTDGEAIFDGKTAIARVSDIPIPGKHNVANVLAALAMVRLGDFDMTRAVDALRTFTGVEHRIEFVRELEGVKYYNDSKSTNLDSLRVALESFEAPIVLIAGGRGKGSDYGSETALVKRNVKALVVFGEDAKAIEDAWGTVVETVRAEELEDAVGKAREFARPGDVVLLSPACASFDMFENFEHRGRVFKACVEGL